MNSKRALKGIVFAGALTAVGCSETGSALTFGEFKAQAYREPETGAFVVNGDEALDNEERLREVYQTYLASVTPAVASDHSALRQGMAVHRVSGADDKWSPAQALNLRYCVSLLGFGMNYSRVVAALNAATASWEGAARVNFIHDIVQDARCNASTPGMTFDVRPVCEREYAALAFYPGAPRSNRSLRIDCSAFAELPRGVTLTGVLRHELGHILGFSHEHTRPEPGACFDDSAGHAPTQYDSASVMHYPQCSGGSSGDLVLTARDRLGARALYP